MPSPRKINLLPAEMRRWLEEELVASGFGDYEGIAERLNFRLEDAGMELRIRKSAIHEFGQEHREFVRTQEAASAWAQDWMQENGLEEEARRHNVLFQMVTALAFKAMQSRMMAEGEDIDPKDLHFIGKMLKDIMASAGIRQTMLAAERKAQSEKLEAAVAAGDIDAEAAAKARAIMGFA